MMYRLIIFVLFIVGCSDTQKYSIDAPKCENTFVVSDYQDKAVLFVHEDNRTEFRPVFSDNFVGNYAFYDCKNKLLVGLFSQKDKIGINVIDFILHRKTFYPENAGFNGVIARYDGGFLYSTAELKNGKVDSKKLGYIPPSLILSDSENSWAHIGAKEANNTNSADGLLYYYSEDKFFDLGKRTVTDIFPYGMAPISELYAGSLYVVAGDFIKIDLKTKKSSEIWKYSQKNHPKTKYTRVLSVPRESVILFVGGVLYFITTSKSWDVETDKWQHQHPKRISYKFKKSAIYAVKDQNLTFKTKLPLSDVVYANSPDKQNIYLFTKSRKVMKYNIKSNTIEGQYTMKINLEDKFHVSAVGFTDKNFIISLGEDRYANSYIVVADRNLTKFSEPYNLKMGDVNIATEKSIHTNSFRVNHL